MVTGGFGVTVLRALGRKRLTKSYSLGPHGAVLKAGTDKAAEFVATRLSVPGAGELWKLLAALERRPDCCVVRAAPSPWCPVDGRPVYRLLVPRTELADSRGLRVFQKRDSEIRASSPHLIGTRFFETTWLATFVEEPISYVMLDFDKVDGDADWRRDLAGTAAWLKRRLPDEFANAKGWYQATSSAADLCKPDLGGSAVSMRMAFVLSRPLTRNQLKAWLGKVPGLDVSVFNTAQEIYTARPLFMDGLVDPMPVRSGVLDGLDDVVEVPETLPELAIERKPAKERSAVFAAGNGAAGLGLLASDALNDALDRVAPDAGSCRSGLGRAARAYIDDVGPERVDVEALAERLAEAALLHRTPAEVTGYGLTGLVRWHLGAAQGAAETTAAVLPAFLGPTGGRDEVIAALHAEIADALGAGDKLSALRHDLSTKLAKARQHVVDRHEILFCCPAHLFTDEQKKVVKREKRKASKLAKRAFGAIPSPRADLFNASPGTGKTTAVAKALAKLESGNVAVYVPTLAKAEEFAEELRRHGPKLPIFVWRGRTASNPTFKEPDPKKLDFNGGSPLMCGRTQELLGSLTRAGVEPGLLCRSCPMRLGCSYISQRGRVAAASGARIVVAAHQLLFAPGGFSSETVVVDEDIVRPAIAVQEMAPARIVDPEKWDEGVKCRETADKVLAALSDRGRELDKLREQGVDRAALKACARHLKVTQKKLRDRLKEVITGGFSDRVIAIAADTIAQKELLRLAYMFTALATEIETGRSGTNTVRLVTRVKKIDEELQRLDLIFVSRLHKPRLTKRASLLLLDGTGNTALASRVVGRPVDEHRHVVERRGRVIQVSNAVYSKSVLLGEGGEGRLMSLRRLIADLGEITDGSLLVGATKAVEDKLALDDVATMHFGAERGMNTAEHLRAVLVVGREQPPIAALEDQARAFMAADERPFVTGLDANEQGRLSERSRERRMRDKTTVFGKVSTHPDPIAQQLLELIRESGVIQMVDRVRAVWHERLIVVATNLPVDLDVDHLVTNGELARIVRQTAVARRNLASRGWHVEPIGNSELSPKTLNVHLLRVLPQSSEFLVEIKTSGEPKKALLLTTLPVGEAFADAREGYPGLRAIPPEHGVLRECMIRHGLVPGWAHLPKAVPDLVTDAAASEVARKLEAGALDGLSAVYSTALYRCAGSRGPPARLIWNPARVAEPAAALASLLGVAVELCPVRQPEKRSAS